MRNRIDSFPPAAGSAKSDLAVDFCTVITHTGVEGTGTPDRPPCAPAATQPSARQAPDKREALPPGGGLYKPHEFQRLLGIKATWPLSKTHLTPQNMGEREKEENRGVVGGGNDAPQTRALIPHLWPNTITIQPNLV